MKIGTCSLRYGLQYDTILLQYRPNVTAYDTIEEFNVDSKAECVQLILAHVARKKYKKETKTSKRQIALSLTRLTSLCHNNTTSLHI